MSESTDEDKKSMFYVSPREAAINIIPIIIILIIAILVCVSQMIARGAGWFEIITTIVVLVIGALVLLLIFSTYGDATIRCASGILIGSPISFIFTFFYSHRQIYNRSCS